MALDAHFYDDYVPGLPCEVQMREERRVAGARRLLFNFRGVRGMTAPALLFIPERASAAQPAPAVIFLHGIGQKKAFLDRIAPFFVQAGFAIGCFDQYTRGERRLSRGTPVWKHAVAFRRRAALTVLETRRFVDVLSTRPEIDPERIYLVGASYGAITGAVAAAMEPRIKAAVLTYGGGNLCSLFQSREVRKALGWKAVEASWIAAWWLAPAEPTRYVARVSPRPLLFQNGLHDGLIPTPAAQALFRTALPPKLMTWYDSDHVGLDQQHTLAVLDEGISWLRRVDRKRTEGGTQNGAGTPLSRLIPAMPRGIVRPVDAGPDAPGGAIGAFEK